MDSSTFTTQPLTLDRCLKALLVRPAQLMEFYKSGGFEPGQVLKLSVGYLLAASFLFGLTAIIRMPAAWQLNQTETLLRFMGLTAMMLFLLIPLLILAWALLQKYAAWFTDAEIPFGKLLGISGLSTAYWAMMFLFSIPLMVLIPVQTRLLEWLPFLLMLATLGLTIRLFKTAYQIFSGFSQAKSLWVTCLPMLTLIGVYLLVRAMTWITVVHQHMGM